MDRHQIDWQQKQDASKIERDLMQRTEDLDDRDDRLDMDIKLVQHILGTGVKPLSAGGDTTTTITSVMDDLVDETNKFRIELNIVHLSAVGIIDAVEHRRLLTLLMSPDEENHHIALEVINNKLKEL